MLNHTIALRTRLCLLLTALLLLAGCNSIDAGSDEATIRARVDEIIHPGDSPEAVKAAFLTLAEPDAGHPMKLEPTVRGIAAGYEELGPGCDYMMVGYLNPRGHLFLLSAEWGFVTFFFNQEQRLTRYRVENKLFMGM